MTETTKTELTKREAFPYNWTASPGDNARIIGLPDSERVSKTEGYEVLAFINAFLRDNPQLTSTTSTTSTTSIHKIEDMLHASGEVMRVKAVAWIKKNWSGWVPR